MEPDYDVLLAADGQAALEMALAQPVELVLSDVMMPTWTASSWSGRCAPTRAPPACPSSCSPPAPARRNPYGAGRPALTTTWPTLLRPPAAGARPHRVGTVPAA
ncbi:hypothetical protein ACQF36_36475 [Streptomyces sp. Marseille-Q5077]|uniref:hypothetical protein n=1 Tax=Streptomyces sp. Marseille-Q5077 TaxID=3418995 RepID=UPI003CFDA73D